MQINFILTLFIIFSGLFFSTKDNKHNRGIYIIVCCAILLLVAALRSPDWFTDRYGLDTLGYKNYFESTLNQGWKEILSIISQHYSSINFDIGFTILNIILGWFTDSFYLFSLFADLLFFIPLGIILYRYSTNIYQLIFAFIFYLALIQVFLLAGARQIYAIGFDMMAFLCVIDRKRWLTIIFFLLGVSIHLSSLLFLIPLLMIWFNVKPQTLKLIHVICFILFPLILLSPNQFILLLSAASGSERYANYGLGEISGGASTFIFLIEALSLLCLIAIRTSDLKKNTTLRSFYVMVPLFTIFAPLVRGNGAMIRTSLYYHLYLMLLVPFAIDYLCKKDTRLLANYVAIIALAYFALKGGSSEYYFFWQI